MLMNIKKYKTEYDVVVVGGGTAGAFAAIAAAQTGAKHLRIEKNSMRGGIGGEKEYFRIGNRLS